MNASAIVELASSFSSSLSDLKSVTSAFSNTATIRTAGICENDSQNSQACISYESKPFACNLLSF